MQAKARRIIPVEKLKDKASEKFKDYKNKTKEAQDEEEREFFLLELLDWYKNEFFQWVNEPDCGCCRTNKFMKYTSSGIPTENELIWGAGRIEVYR